MSYVSKRLASEAVQPICITKGFGTVHSDRAEGFGTVRHATRKSFTLIRLLRA
jgi:hypothetical protein